VHDPGGTSDLEIPALRAFSGAVLMAYMSIGSAFRNNGDRHARKAEFWLAEGKPEYALGSMCKAVRNWKRADDFDEWMKVPAEFQKAYDATLLAITKNLCEYGTGGNPFQGIW
jgi:hypothetical protein